MAKIVSDKIIETSALHLGSHVFYKGKRMRVARISKLEVALISVEERGVYINVLAWDVEPIPITSKLLVELGFEKDGDTFTKREKTESDNILSRTYIGVTMICGMHFRVEACDAVTVCGNLIVSYLHELENFIYLTLGKELIKE